MSYTTYIFLIWHIHVIDFYYMSSVFLNNICMWGLHFIYITLFSSNIYMLVIYLFYVTQKIYTCYCSPWHMLFEKSHNMHMFFFGLQYAWTHVITRHGIQVHSVTMGSYKFYGWVSWSCFNCVITERLRVTVNPQSLQPDKEVWVLVLISQ